MVFDEIVDALAQARMSITLGFGAFTGKHRARAGATTRSTGAPVPVEKVRAVLQDRQKLRDRLDQQPRVCAARLELRVKASILR